MLQEEESVIIYLDLVPVIIRKIKGGEARGGRSSQVSPQSSLVMSFCERFVFGSEEHFIYERNPAGW